jgi:hypothetical protein
MRLKWLINVNWPTVSVTPVFLWRGEGVMMKTYRLMSVGLDLEVSI